MPADLASFLGMLALMALVVFGLRLFIRRPRGVSLEDPPGVRTIAVFSGNDPDFFTEDQADGPFVGVRLFTSLLEGLRAAGIEIASRQPVDYAQGAECVVNGERFGVVLEWLDPKWAIGVDWVPTASAERRHIRLTRAVYSPRDSRALRRLLEAIDAWLKRNPKVSHVRWHRKERWVMEDPSGSSEGPIG